MRYEAAGERHIYEKQDTIVSLRSQSEDIKVPTQIYLSSFSFLELLSLFQFRNCKNIILTDLYLHINLIPMSCYQFQRTKMFFCICSSCLSIYLSVLSVRELSEIFCYAIIPPFMYIYFFQDRQYVRAIAPPAIPDPVRF